MGVVKAAKASEAHWEFEEKLQALLEGTSLNSELGASEITALVCQRIGMLVGSAEDHGIPITVFMETVNLNIVEGYKRFLNVRTKPSEDNVRYH